jgi:uncharacterized small protein (DUF1192 family)
MKNPNLPTQCGRNQTSVRYWKKKIALLQSEMELERQHARENAALAAEAIGSRSLINKLTVRIAELQDECSRLKRAVNIIDWFCPNCRRLENEKDKTAVDL